MIATSERNFVAFGPLHPAATLASALVALGLLMAAAPLGRADAGAVSADVRTASTACSVGDEVSNFVCRNAWLAHLRWHYR
jgi:hypothetical protein